MLGLPNLVIGLLLLSQFGLSLPGTNTKRDFKISDDDCKRSQKDKDLITTELGRANDIIKAAAGATLDSNNKWANYFFDDKTIKDPDRIKSYYQKLSSLDGDTNYNYAIVCPLKDGDNGWSSCSSGRVWAATFTFGDNRVVICPAWFDGIKNSDGSVFKKKDSSIVETNCQPGAPGEKNWQDIAQFKGSKSFNLVHESTHTNYTDGPNNPLRPQLRSLDFAYDRPDCKALRDGTHVNSNLCSPFDNDVCPAEAALRNADTLAFVAAGIYWEDKCGKSIDIEPTSGETEPTDPGTDTVEPPPAPAEEIFSTTPTTNTVSSKITPAPSIGPLSDCSVVRTTITGTIAPGPQTYCQCGEVQAGINTVTSGSVLYSVCAGDPKPTVGTTTIKKQPSSTKKTNTAQPTPIPLPSDCDDSGIFSTSDCDGKCGIYDCKSYVTALGQLEYLCDCPS